MLPLYLLAHHTPPPAPAPTLTVNAKGRAYLSKALLCKLNLRAGQPANLLPPSADYPYWQLDLRPTAERRISWYGDTRARLEGVRLPADMLSPTAPLTLALVAGVSTHSTGLHRLTPVAAPASR